MMKIIQKLSISLMISLVIGFIGCTDNQTLNGNPPVDNPPQEFQLYLYNRPDFELESEEQLQKAWDTAKVLPEVKSVAQSGNYSSLVFMQPYSVGVFNPETAEWIIIVASEPQNDVDTVMIAIVCLDYQTFKFKKAYESIYPAKVVSKEQAMSLMSDNPQYEWWENWGVDEKEVELIGPYFIYSYPPGDFGGIFIVNKNVDELIFSATTVWDGTGRLIIPAMD